MNIGHDLFCDACGGVVTDPQREWVRFGERYDICASCFDRGIFFWIDRDGYGALHMGYDRMAA